MLWSIALPSLWLNTSFAVSVTYLRVWRTFFKPKILFCIRSSWMFELLHICWGWVHWLQNYVLAYRFPRTNNYWVKSREHSELSEYEEIETTQPIVHKWYVDLHRSSNLPQVNITSSTAPPMRLQKISGIPDLGLRKFMFTFIWQTSVAGSAKAQGDWRFEKLTLLADRNLVVIFKSSFVCSSLTI